MIRRMCALGLLALALSACGGAAPAIGPAVPHTIAQESKLVDTTAPVDLPQVGQVAPDFQYTMADGSTHLLSQLRGKKVLVNFWATWCGPCRSEMPDLQKALGETGDSVVVLGVNKAQELKEIAPFADELRISFPLIANPAGDIAGRYGAQNLPTSYFINSDGTIGLKKTGVMNYSFIKTHLDLLK
jgi:thiol-disulfide isomerase/thioredoxin